MGVPYSKDILERLKRKGTLHIDDIYAYLIKKYRIAKKRQKKFKTNIKTNYLYKLIEDNKIAKVGHKYIK